MAGSPSDYKLARSISLKDRGQQQKEGAPTMVTGTQRFEIDLSSCMNEFQYAEINYKALTEQRELAQGASKLVNNEAEKSFPSKSDSSGDDLHKVMLQKALPKRQLEDLLDCGEGYDQDDTLIDDSEAYEEALPDYLMTEFGGHYVNTGPLKLKRVKDDPSIEERLSDVEQVKDTDDTAEEMKEAVPGDLDPKVQGTSRQVVPSYMHQHPRDWKNILTTPLAPSHKKQKLVITGLIKKKKKVLAKKRIQLDPTKRLIASSLSSIMETIDSVAKASHQESESANLVEAEVILEPPTLAMLDASDLKPMGSGAVSQPFHWAQP